MQPLHDPNRSTTHHSWVTDSLIDWCESNFEVVWWIAEFFNTVSNLWIMAFGVYGLYMAHRFQYEWRFMWSYFAVFLVGVGSALFHGTLTYHMQLLDELPMLFGSATFIYCLIKPYARRPPFWAAVLCLAYPTIISVLYIDNRIAHFFQNAYVLEVLTIVTLAIITRKHFPTARSVSVAASQGTRTLRVIPAEQAHWLFYSSLAAYGTGSALWVIDNLLCYSHLLPLKEMIGWPWRGALELHGWWHFFSGLGTYLCVTYTVAVRANAVILDARAEPLRKEWPAGVRSVALKSWLGLPYVALGTDAEAASDAKAKQE